MQIGHFSTLSLLGLFLPLTSHAYPNCPLLGPDFPAPTKLSCSPTIQSAKAILTRALTQVINSSNSSYGPFDATNTSFSLEVFSIHESDPVFEKHFTAPAVATYQDGTKNVNSNTTYRVGSLTKLMTVYTFLIEAGDMKFNDPITKYVPELRDAAEALNATQDPIDYVAWEDVTIGELASQMSGIARDYSGFGELDSPVGEQGIDPSTLGLPPLNASAVPLCAGGAFCDRQQFFAGFTKRHPVYAPSTGAIYSNAAYMILSYALENITGIDFPTTVQNSLFTPLNLSSGTSWTLPPADNSTAIIPDGSSFALNLGDETAAGGMYTTPRDAVTLGRSILSSALLRPALTRRWMKPRVFTSAALSSVGAPWEIQRLQISPNHRLVDLYTKAGDIPGYSSLIALIPSWDLGFVIMTAGADPGPTDNIVVLADLIAKIFLPAVETAAREEADAAFSGTYRSSNPNLNSSITLTTNPRKPGLGITSWISNSTDVLASKIGAPSARLYPSGLSRKLPNGDSVTGYRAVFEDTSATPMGGPFTPACETWQTVDQTYWGSVASDEFLITVGSDGVAKSVTPRITRAKLERVDIGARGEERSVRYRV